VLPLGLVVSLFGARTFARSRTFQLFGRIVPRIETNEPVAALTFDDGPEAERVQELVDRLRTLDVRATFFVNGFHLAQDPAPARRLVAAGHELGNHTFSHERMVLKAQATYREEIERTDALIRAAGHGTEVFFRPPFTWKLLGLPWFLARTGRTTITFDVEPESYPEVAGRSETIVDHVLARVRPGSIVLLHPWYDTGRPSREAIPGIVAGLRGRGYRWLTVSELLSLQREGHR
jgi:peptidoglycan/xylan/chitin deacetylase (PgdA/CDA1 family)